MNFQRWGLIALVTLVLCSNTYSDTTFEIEEEAEADEEAEDVLRPRNFASRAPASEETEGTWSVSHSSKLSFGLFVVEDVLVRERSGPESRNLPVLEARVGYGLAPQLAGFVFGGADTNVGANDPGLGLSYHFPVATSFSVLGTLTGTFPVSTASRDTGRSTTIEGAAQPVFTSRGWFVGATASFAFHALSSTGSSTAEEDSSFSAFTPRTQSSSLTATADRAQTSTRGSFFAGYDVTESFSASLGAGVESQYLDSGFFSWTTDATLARLSVAGAGLTASASFGLVSPATTQSPTLPDQPVMGLRLQYVFGETDSLGLTRHEGYQLKR